MATVDKSDAAGESVILRYAVAAMAVLAALGVRMLLDPVLGTQAPYLPFIFAAMVASRYGGRGPGLAATALSALAIAWFFLEPRGSFAVNNRDAVAGLSLFVLIGAVISFLLGQLRRPLAYSSEPRQRAGPIDVSSGVAARAPEMLAAVHGLGFGMKSLRQKPHLVWFAATALLLLLVGLFFVAVWGRFSDREEWSIRARDVLATTDSLFSKLQDAEIGQRGYLLTGQDPYLAPYNTALNEAPRQLENLRRLTADNPSQQARIEELRVLMAGKFAELKGTIELQQTRGSAAALQVVATGRGKQMMDQIRGVIAAMRSEEASLLAERSGGALAAARGMGIVLLSGVMLLMILLIVGARDIDRNITRRQQAQQALSESESQFRTLADAIPTLCWMANADGWIFWYNQRWYEYTGTTPEQMEGWGWQSVHDPEELPKVLERWKESIEEGKPFDMVFPLRGADGAFRPFLTRVVPMRDQNGKVVRWFGTNTDISEQRKTEEALRQSLERLEKVMEIQTVGVMFWDLNTGAMVDANDTFLKLMGYSRSDVNERKLTWQKLTPPEYIDVSRAEVEKFLATGRVGPYEKEYFRKDGTRHWLLLAGSSLGNNQCVEFCVDIADRKKAEQALAESESRLRAVLDCLPVAVFTADSVGQLKDVNPVTREIWAGDAPMLPMSEYSKEYHGWWPDTGRRVESHEWPLSRAVKGETIRDVMVEIESFDGKRKFLRIDASPIRGPRGENYGAVAVTTDITERKRAEDDLRESEQRFRNLADNISQFAWMADANGWIYWYNQRWYEYTGTNLEQMQGWGWRKVHHPEHVDRVVARIKKSFETGEPWEDTFPMRGKDGQYRWFLSRALPIRDAGGIVRWFGTHTDITEQRQAQEKIHHYNTLLQAHVRILQSAISCHTEEELGEACLAVAEELTQSQLGFIGEINFATGLLDAIATNERGWASAGALEAAKRKVPKGFKIYGIYSRVLMDGKGFYTNEPAAHPDHIGTPEGHPPLKAFLGVPLKQGDKTTGIIALGNREGGYRPQDLEFVEALSVTIAQAFARRRANEEVLRLGAIVDSSEDAIIGKTLEGVITSWSPGATRLYGYSATEAIGQAISMLVPEGHTDEVPEILHRLANGEHVEQFEALRRRKDGSVVEVSLKVSPIFDAPGHMVGASSIARDITERKRAEEEIRRLNAELEERVRQRTAQLEAANKELEAFAYSVSHDLRAPLRGIDGWSLALAEDYGNQLDATAHEYLGRVRSETQRMGLLIDDLLKLSRATRMEMQSDTIDLTAIARTIAARLTENNPDRRIHFIITDGLQAIGDARLLEIVLTNLFSNAVKFTGPRAEAYVEFGRMESGGECPFYVRDNGVGFDMAFSDMLFGAFQRLHPSDEFPGAGIGLATVQRIIHRHGGRVWAEAQPDQGATFYFTVGGR